MTAISLLAFQICIILKLYTSYGSLTVFKDLYWQIPYFLTELRLMLWVLLH